jgi:hypothetical protein
MVRIWFRTSTKILRISDTDTNPIYQNCKTNNKIIAISVTDVHKKILLKENTYILTKYLHIFSTVQSLT